MLIKFRYSLVHTEPHNLSLSRALIGFIISSSGHTLFLPVPTLGVQRFPSLSQWACFHQTLGFFHSLSLSTWVLPLPSFQSSTIRPFWSLPSGHLLQSCPTFTNFFHLSHFCLQTCSNHFTTPPSTPTEFPPSCWPSKSPLIFPLHFLPHHLQKAIPQLHHFCSTQALVLKLTLVSGLLKRLFLVLPSSPVNPDNVK